MSYRLEKIKVKLIRILKFSRANVLHFLLKLRTVKKDRTYVFHHLPRCGGTSLRQIFGDSFNFYRDYRMGWSTIYPAKVPIKKLGTQDCMAGHFECQSKHLFQRYPELYTDKRYFIFSFIREPLDLRISYFFYLEKNDEKKLSGNFEDFLVEEPNYLATILNVTEYNYKEVLDRYNFVGIFEEYELSLNFLGDLLGADSLRNIKINDAKKDSRVNQISDKILLEFKKQNDLDYKIYNYCLQKFNKMKKSRLRI